MHIRHCPSTDLARASVVADVGKEALPNTPFVLDISGDLPTPVYRPNDNNLYYSTSGAKLVVS